MESYLFHIGRYFMLLKKVFAQPEKGRIYLLQTLKEMDAIGLQSLGIVAIISFFMGAVVVIQTSLNMDEGTLVPDFMIGYAAAQTIILEFSSTMVALILAGKVGSKISSEIGSMRVTEQIDALEIMGVNSASFLILPKIVASIFMFPFITVFSMFVGIIGGYITGVFGGILSHDAYIQGITLDFKPFVIFYALFKSCFFAFAISSIPSYHGYYAYGGSMDVGRASTHAVVYTSVAILVINYIITQLMLA